MNSTTTALALALLGWTAGWAPAQEPPKPQEPPRPQEPTDPPKQQPAPTLDRDLRAAVEAFKRLNSYRFRLEGQVNPPWNQAQEPRRTGNVAHAKERAAGGSEQFALDGTFERDQPLQVAAEALEAFRSKDRVVYRGNKEGDWSVMSRVPMLVGTPTDDSKPPADPAKRPDDGKPGGDLKLLPLIATIQAPSDLLDRLETQVVSCTRVAEDKDAGTLTFECLIKSETGPRTTPAPIAAVNSKLRIVLKSGVIDEITLDGQPPFAAAPPAAKPADPASAAAAAPTDVADSTLRYRLTNFDDAHVEVPEEVAALLAR